MLKLMGARPVGVRDTAAVLRTLDRDPIASAMIAARVHEHGVESRSIGGELWSRGNITESLCFAGANLVPIVGSAEDLSAFADRATRGPRLCSSVVGRAELVMPMWSTLEGEWGPAREVRDCQPLLALYESNSMIADPNVRRVRITELDQYLVAAIDMFIAEVGVDPCSGDGGRSYRRRVSNLINAGRAWARFEDDRVVFKAEVAAQSNLVGQIQGVWVTPDCRGRGLGSAGTATVANAIIDSGRVASLYVNGFNTAARAAYAKIGFTQVGTFATVLLD